MQAFSIFIMDAHIQISIETRDNEIAEILIAELSALGFDGFEEKEQLLNAFIPGELFKEFALVHIIEKYGLEFEKRRIPKQNWNEQWEKNYEPVIVGSFCSIRSGFHHPIHHTKYEIIITPKMSFGTGHHATTYLMIAAMEKLAVHQKNILDFGTGTGVLAILAEKMGAKEILAIDIDDWSIENAKENFSVNHCQGIKLEKSDGLPPGIIFDVILANINKSVIFNNIMEMKQHLAKDGVLLLSGILADDLYAMRSKAEECSLHISEVNEQNSWICVRFAKEG
ncbi:MAG: 50S ribosomal protein L11 methyltransferase [Chitinophagales bacterium]